MQLIPVIGPNTSLNTDLKCGHIGERQGGFVKQILNSRTWSIGEADFISSRLNNRSVRDQFCRLWTTIRRGDSVIVFSG